MRRFHPTAGPGTASRRASALILLFMATALPAQADWRALAPQPDQELLSPYNYLVGAGGSLWSFSNDGVRLTLADGSTRVVTREYYDRGQRLADGGALLYTNCSLQRVDAQGRLGWSTPFASSPQTSCYGFAALASGAAWLNRGVQLDAFDAHGLQTATVTPRDNLSFASITMLPSSGDVIAALNPKPQVGTGPALLARYNPRGATIWSWSSAAPATLDHVTLGNDGAVLAVLNNAAEPGLLRLQRWSADGALSWSQLLPTQDPEVHAIIPAAGGESYVFTGEPRGTYAVAHNLLRVARDGSIRWRQSISCWVLFARNPVQLDADDGLNVRCGVGGLTQLLHWTANGSSTPLDLPLGMTPTWVRRLDDGSLLALVNDGTRTRSFVIRNGQVSAHALDSAQQAAPVVLIAQHIAADGSSYIATRRAIRVYSDEEYTLSKFSASGARLWTVSRSDRFRNTSRSVLTAGAGKVCIAEGSKATWRDAQELACFNDADGSPAWSAVLAPEAEALSVRILADGRVVAVTGRFVSSSLGSALHRYSADGQPLAIISDEDAQQASTDSAGRTTIVTKSSIVQYAFDGTINYRVDRRPDVTQAYPQIATADDGSVWLTERGNLGERPLRALRPDGSTRWLVNPGVAVPSEEYTLVATGDAVYLMLQSTRDTPAGLTESHLIKFSAADGAEQWRQISRNPISGYTGDGRFALSPDGNHVLRIHAWRDRLRLQRLRSSDGQPEQERFVACDARCLKPIELLAVDANGTARAALNLLDTNAGTTAAVLAIDHAGAPGAPTRLDQPGIAGAWYSPYANGEGIVLDWLAAQRTLFGAWFTYTTRGGNDPAQLRWYTIQAGDIPANAASVQLPILETTGGNFDAGPPASPIRVGTAELSFDDCDGAILRYDFDAGHNDGVEGSITLSRLVAATADCIQADGSTRPGTGIRPPQGGFDARMSGTWFEEATSGQGLQFTIQPGGSFFAPWFTYDPQGQGNDPNREHWFTLQGNLATAQNGRADVLITQSLGGVFDRVPTYNGFAVGKATVTMTACDKSRVDYRFDDNELAGAYRGKRGTLELTKIGGCQ